MDCFRAAISRFWTFEVLVISWGILGEFRILRVSDLSFFFLLSIYLFMPSAIPILEESFHPILVVGRAWSGFRRRGLHMHSVISTNLNPFTIIHCRFRRKFSSNFGCGSGVVGF